MVAEKRICPKWCSTEYRTLMRRERELCQIKKFFDKVAQLIANRFSVDVETVTEGMTFQQDLGADSLDVVELVMELEDEFGVQISDEDAENITTIWRRG